MIPNFSSNDNVPDLFQWRGKVTQRRNAIADSDNGSSDFEKDILLGNECGFDSTAFCRNCCSCKPTRRSRIKSKSNNALLNTRSEIRSTYKSSTYPEQLEMKVLNDEIFVQELNEKHGNVKEQVERITEILRTLSMYAHCLEMKHRVTIRLQHLISKIVPAKENSLSGHGRWESISKTLSDIYQTCNENSELPDLFYDNLEDHRDKHRDFSKASTNFCRVLQQPTNLSNSQLRKLELQYEEIKLIYKDSSSNIETQLNEIIDTYYFNVNNRRAVVAERSLQNMAPVLQYTIEEEKSMWYFLKEITLSNMNNHPSQPERVLSVKSLPEKIGSTSGERPKCTCVPRSFLQKSAYGLNIN